MARFSHPGVRMCGQFGFPRSRSHAHFTNWCGVPEAAGGGGIAHVSMMPGMTGMMSEEDMTALQKAQGVEASKLFLTQMIQHHQGAITVAQNEIDSGQYPAAIAMAQSIVTSQQQQINTMQSMLASL